MISTSVALIMIGNVMMITKMSLIAMTSVIDDRLARVIFVHEKQDQRLALIFRIIPSLYLAIPSNPLWFSFIQNKTTGLCRFSELSWVSIQCAIYAASANLYPGELVCRGMLRGLREGFPKKAAVLLDFIQMRGGGPCPNFSSKMPIILT